MLYGDDVATTLINYMNLHWNEYLAEMFGTAILLFSYLSSISFPFSSKTSCTLDIGNDDGMDGAPNSANINLIC
jgi:hypothetical protein